MLGGRGGGDKSETQPVPLERSLKESVVKERNSIATLNNDVATWLSQEAQS